jgi:hypothetical protein
MRLTLTILMMLSAVCAFADNGGYDVANISPALKEKAHAVKRTEETRLEVQGGESIYKQKYALTILDENGDRFARLVVHYDKFVEVRSIAGTLYDAQGKSIKELKNRDVQDLSAVDDNNLMDDSRRKVHEFHHSIYPYTVEYEIELRLRNTFFFPTWAPHDGQNMSVQQSRFTIVYPAGYQVRYKALNFSGKPAEGVEKDRKTLTWQLQEHPAIEVEDFSPPWHDLAPIVRFAPSDFEFGGYKGNMSSWENLGKFMFQLNKGRDELTPAAKAKVASLTSGLTDPKQKVKALYEHLQKTTRYVSIQLGIGGWQPLEAKFVAEKSYGDCKALTNYMYSLLKEAGIRSYYTLVKAGEFENILPDFPSSQFNHVILCVPLAKDTIWLECTSQTTQAGYLGDFTSDRYVLLVDEAGGKLLTTPAYRIKDNLQDRKVTAVVDEEGNMKASILTSYFAMQQDDLHGLIHGLSKQKVKEHLQKHIDFSTYELDDFTYTEFGENVPGIKEKLDLTVSKYATVSGKRLFIQPNLISRSYRKLSAEKRRSAINVPYEYRDMDTAEIELPAGYKPESVPQDVTLQTKFGTYKSSVRVQGNKLVYTRTIERSSGRYPSSDYESLSAFYAAIYKADRSKVVLVKE